MVEIERFLWYYFWCIQTAVCDGDRRATKWYSTFFLPFFTKDFAFGQRFTWRLCWESVRSAVVDAQPHCEPHYYRDKVNVIMAPAGRVHDRNTKSGLSVR